MVNKKDKNNQDKEWFTYDEPQTPMTREDIKDINTVLPSEIMTKFMNDNKQQIYNDSWDKIRGSNAISYTNPLLAQGVNYGTKIESMLLDLKNISGVRIGTLRQELNRRMGLVSFIKMVSIEKLEPIYRKFGKKDILSVLFDNLALFESQTLKEKEQKYCQMWSNDKMKSVAEIVREELKSLGAASTEERGIFTVIQMYLVHIKMLNMSKRNKKTKERSITINTKYKFDFDEWCTDTEPETDSET